jgi:ATP phosphoribosyltransferase regulatory subunit
MSGLVDGTRFSPPDVAARREAGLAKLRELYASWGYAPVEVPVLERFDPSHPREAQAFKLIDGGSEVLALRSDFTPALARLVALTHPGVAAGERKPLRFRYAGTVWHANHPELAGMREFTQVGIELVGVSNARSDAEIIHLARESVRAVGLAPRIEVGNPAYVKALLEAAEVPREHQGALADAIDRKDRSDVLAAIEALGLRGKAADAILQAPDLYGSESVLALARRLAPDAAANLALDRLEGVLAEFEDASELLLDLGLARRLSYYTGVTFRAFTPDYGRPLLGGGRYDAALLPYAAGFSMGLERLLGAATGDIPAAAPLSAPLTPEVLALDDPAARALRAAGVCVARAVAGDEEGALREAAEAGIPYLLVSGSVLATGTGGPATAARERALQGLLTGERTARAADAPPRGEGA